MLVRGGAAQRVRGVDAGRPAASHAVPVTTLVAASWVPPSVLVVVVHESRSSGGVVPVLVQFAMTVVSLPCVSYRCFVTNPRGSCSYSSWSFPV